MNTKNQALDQGVIGLIILILCCIAILWFGCAENPAAPAMNNSQDKAVIIGDNNGGSDDPTVDLLGLDTLFVDSDTVVGLVTSEGGELVLHIQGKKVDFVIKEGALADSVTISIIGSRYRVGRSTEFYVYECGPSGLQFSIPLELTQLINRSDGAAATLHYFDESYLDGDGTGWETIGVSHVQGGKGTFLLHHFSKYGISYSVSQGGQLGDVDNATHLD